MSEQKKTPFNYKQYTIEFIREVLKRPRMYFNDLADLEFQLFGQATIASELNYVEDKTFFSEFSDWLYNTHKISCSAGWAYGIKHQIDPVKAGLRSDDVDYYEEQVKAFKHYAEAFFIQWTAK